MILAVSKNNYGKVVTAVQRILLKAGCRILKSKYFCIDQKISLFQNIGCEVRRRRCESVDGSWLLYVYIQYYV